MPQKPLKASGGRVGKPGKKQQQAANRHGKAPQTRKGRLAIAPRDAKLLAAYKDARELTKAINSKNEAASAAKATSGGGRLAVLKAGPPVLASKDGRERQALKKKEQAAAVAAVAAARAGRSAAGGGDASMDGESD